MTGTVAVDSIINTPNTGWVDTGVHYRMSTETSGDSCGKCHTPQGELAGLYGAHDATVKYLTKNLADDHPISMNYPTVLQDTQFNIPRGQGYSQMASGYLTARFSAPHAMTPIIQMNRI